jgi:hypothetical protein
VTCAGCHANFVPTRAGQECCSDACRQRKRRGRTGRTVADALAEQELTPDGLPPMPTEAERMLHLLQAQPRVPAFTGRPVQVDATHGPGGDPAPILRALRARRSA